MEKNGWEVSNQVPPLPSCVEKRKPPATPSSYSPCYHASQCINFGGGQGGFGLPLGGAIWAFLPREALCFNVCPPNGHGKFLNKEGIFCLCSQSFPHLPDPNSGPYVDLNRWKWHKNIYHLTDYPAFNFGWQMQLFFNTSVSTVFSVEK